MAEWTAIADSNLEPNAPIRSVDGVALRDNPIAITEGAAGAPRNKWPSLDSAVQDYILASDGFQAFGAPSVNNTDSWWSSSRDFRGGYYEVPGSGAGVTFFNQSSRSITFTVVVYIWSECDDTIGIRLRDENETAVVSASKSVARGTLQTLQVNVTQAAGTTKLYTLEGSVLNGSGTDNIYYRGLVAFIPSFA